MTVTSLSLGTLSEVNVSIFRVMFFPLCSWGCFYVLLILLVLRLMGASLGQGDFARHIEHFADGFKISELKFCVQHSRSESAVEACDRHILIDSFNLIVRFLEAFQISQEGLAFSLFNVGEISSRL